MVTSLSERFRRAILSDDLPSAKTIAGRAVTETSKDAQPFDIRNQRVLRSGHQYPHSYSEPKQDSVGGGSSGSSESTMMEFGKSTSTSFLNSCNVEMLPTLSSTQYRLTRQNRIREKNHEGGRCKSSLTLAIENGASIELIQWLLDMGHERDQFTSDVRNCTMVSLAAQHNRVDVIESICIDAVAHAASIHHQRSITFDSPYRQRRVDEDEDEEQEEEEETEGERGGKKAGMMGVEEREENVDADPKHIEHSFQAQEERHALRSKSSNHQSRGVGGEESGRVSLESNFTKTNDESSLADMEEDNDNDEDPVAKQLLHLLNTPDELGRTALALASMRGYQDVVIQLLGLGCNINLADFEGNTPLHYAASYNHLLTVQLLIEKGCAFATKNVVGFTAADYAYTSNLKSALEAFARAKYERDRKGVITHDNEERILKTSQKLKNTLFPSSTKPLQSSTQYRLATHLRDLDF